MGGRQKKSTDRNKNKRLDLFLAQLDIQEEKRKKILNYVEQLTFDTLQNKPKPSLRLQKPKDVVSKL